MREPKVYEDMDGCRNGHKPALRYIIGDACKQCIQAKRKKKVQPRYFNLFTPEGRMK